MSPPESTSSSEPSVPAVSVTPGAAAELRKALGGRGGMAVRLWVEPGMHPKPLMAIDRVGPRDEVVTVDGIPLVLDPPSRRFLDGAQVRYWANREPPSFEVAGPMLPAAPPPAPTAGGPAAPSAAPLPESANQAEREGRMREAWKRIFDPEIPMNILDLGLIYGVRWTGPRRVEVDMTMTSPGCPVAESLVAEVQKAAKEAGGLEEARVSVVWDPPWGPDRMSELAKRQLGFL